MEAHKASLHTVANTMEGKSTIKSKITVLYMVVNVHIDLG